MNCVYVHASCPPKLGGQLLRDEGAQWRVVPFGTNPSSLTSFEASPYSRGCALSRLRFARARASRGLALRAGSRFAVREASPPNLGGEGRGGLWVMGFLCCL